MSCCKITSVCLSFAAKCWRCFTNALMTLRHYAFSRQHRTQFSEDVYAFVLRRYVAVQIWRVKELFVLGIVASTTNALSDNTFQIAFFFGIRVMVNFIRSLTDSGFIWKSFFRHLRRVCILNMKSHIETIQMIKCYRPMFILLPCFFNSFIHLLNFFSCQHSKRG